MQVRTELTYNAENELCFRQMPYITKDNTNTSPMANAFND